MDDPVVLAATVLGLFLLGFLLRITGAVLGGFGLAVYAVLVAVASGSGSGQEVVGAWVLGAGGGFALGWAGSLARRFVRRP